MKIDLSWVNRNSGEDGTRLYRSTAPMNPSSLPDPIAVLDPGVTTYTDEDVVRNTVYYYRTQVFKGTDAVLSNEQTIIASPYLGPGPQTLIGGDLSCGYFGTMPSSALFSGEELAAFIGLTVGTLYNSTTDWLKFAFRGKIIYTPLMPVRLDVSWSDLYNCGAIWGNEPSLYTSASNPQLPPKVITRNDESFIVRLMTGLNPDVRSLPVQGTADASVQTAGSEWTELLLRSIPTIVAANAGKWANFVELDMVRAPTAAYYYTLTQELASSAQVATRGQSYSNRADYVVMAQYQTIGTGVRSGTFWRPVLEFVFQ